ncbi:MAG TPA: FecR domain-containing protein [Vicinamibacterales bacterium]|nr:FecR domain-containing protein [Vicinamibacterales bacterium]
MSDYLWDPTEPPDPEVQCLEQLLGRLRTTTSAPQVTVRLKPDTTARLGMGAGDWRLAVIPMTASPKPRAPSPVRYVGVRFLAPALALAAAIALLVANTWSAARFAARSWSVAAMSGTPQIDTHRFATDTRLGVGQTLTTDARSTARIEVSTIGEVTVAENTRVRLIETRAAHHQLALDRGTLHAIITAPPGQFVVDTASARATDLGCVYTLRVDEDGTGLLSVSAGWVAFEDKGHESFVPAGASSRTDRINGPGTPSFDDADAVFHDALDRVDTERDLARRRQALAIVLQHARERDAMTLWHLIPRVGDEDRGAVVDALAFRVPMPGDVTREAAMQLDRTALDSWWNALGLLDTTWWRGWKRPLPN